MQDVLLPPLIGAPPDRPLVFLGGPIQGAPDWQADAIQLIRAQAGERLLIASPRLLRVGERFVYADQVDWETTYLQRAGVNGCVLFWLPPEHEHDPERAYAQTSRFEAGEWLTRSLLQGARVAVGVHDRFSGAKYFRHRIARDFPQVPLSASLEAVVTDAVRLALAA